MYEQYLIRLLAPLSLYNLRAPHNGGELAALGGELDSVSGLVELVERESLLATAESEGLDRREVLFAHKPAAVTQEDRREAIAALLRISEDSLTPRPSTILLPAAASGPERRKRRTAACGSYFPELPVCRRSSTRSGRLF